MNSCAQHTTLTAPENRGSPWCWSRTVAAVATASGADNPPCSWRSAPRRRTFSLQGSDGRTHSLADYRGKQAVVLAWFPKAFTGG